MRSRDMSDNIVSPQATLVSLLSLITDILGKGKVGAVLYLEPTNCPAVS